MKIRELLDRMSPIYVNGVDLRLILSVHDAVKEADERGELGFDELAFIRFVRGLLAALMAFTLSCCLFTLVIIPLLMRTEIDALIAPTIVIGMFVTLGIPNRILGGTLRLRYGGENSGVRTIWIIDRIAYVVSWVFLGTLILLLLVFLAFVISGENLL